MGFYRASGLLPVWSLAGNETDTMIGYHAVPVLYDAIKKGLTTVDRREALAAMKKSALQRKHGLQYYQMPEPVTLEQLQAEAAKEELPRIGTITVEQWAAFGPLVAGWQHTISGPTIGYHSAYPHVKQALISRASDGKQVIEWQTAPVPSLVGSSALSQPEVFRAMPADVRQGCALPVRAPNFSSARLRLADESGENAHGKAQPCRTSGGTAANYETQNASAVTFVWLAGIDVDVDEHRFDLAVDGVRWLSFHTPKTSDTKTFSVMAENGAKLTFHATHQDQFGDYFGYMFLTVPRALLTAGQPLRLTITGEKANADDWYMTFEYELKTQLKATNVFALVSYKGETQQTVRIDYEFLGLESDFTVSCGTTSVGETHASSGVHTIFFPLPQDSKSNELEVIATRREKYAAQTETKKLAVTLRPVRPFAYLPADLENESVSKTLEYAYDDWCIAQLAKDLGATADYELFSRRAQFYRNLFDKETGFMRGKLSDGSWREPFSPKFSQHRQDDYTEGNAWQYSWSVMHDVGGLIELMGGPASFVKKLDQLFTESPDLEGTNASPDISGLIGQYAHGNEPSHHIAYLYALAGQPWRTQERVREITAKLYHATPEGLCGNEDCGQMSAWYIFSTLGFYPVNPANGEYVIGTPHFPSVTLKLPDNKTFRIVAHNVTTENYYIQSAALNGQPFTKNFITHQQITNGGTLELIMGNKPNQSWGRA